MIRRPPRAALFPSTPLFRSALALESTDLDVVEGHVGLSRTAEREPVVVDGLHPFGVRLLLDLRPGGRVEVDDRQDGGALGEDRKSTRLNSSHANISYAVFCLNDPATTESCPLPLHAALPICPRPGVGRRGRCRRTRRPGPDRRA